MKDEVAVACETSESIFTALDLPCPEPQLREIVDNEPVSLKT